jgi:hypothetical protein
VAGEASMGTMTTTAMLIKMVEAEAAAEVDAGAVGAVGGSVVAAAAARQQMWSRSLHSAILARTGGARSLRGATEGGPKHPRRQQQQAAPWAAGLLPREIG